MKTIFLGVDVSISRRPFAYAALDENLQLIAVGAGEILEILAFAAGQTDCIAAISAPAHSNLGSMKDENIRASLDPAPPQGKFTNLRQAEYELEHLGLGDFRTPQKEENCHPRVKKGFNLYRNLETLGYSDFPSEQPRQLLETHSEAGFISILGQRPMPGSTLEGRLQRQLILYEQELPVIDPMRFFEEITSRKLKHGLLPTEYILSEFELSAIMAAFIAWLVKIHPEKTVRYGNPQEGWIILPARAVQPALPRSHTSPFLNKAYSTPLIDKGEIE